MYTNSNPNQNDPYYSFQADTTFLGNFQPFVFFVALFGGVYLIFWLLTLKKINRFKSFRHKVKAIFKKRMRYSFLHEIFYYTEYYVFFFAVYQFTGVNSYIDASASNLAIAVIVALLYAVWLVTITYHAVQYKRRLANVPQKFNFLALEASQFPM
jgi:hypothetical protein